MDFIFSQAAADLKLETSIGKGSIKANEFELISRTADFELISLDKSMVSVQTGNARLSRSSVQQSDSLTRHSFGIGVYREAHEIE